ncbi:MAG: hypothetical protein WB558_03600 [Terriglobales bacterium]
MRRIIVAAALLSTLFIGSCKKQIVCDPADSEAVCKAFQQCLRSETSAEVCRMGEQDANKLEKNKKH